MKRGTCLFTVCCGTVLLLWAAVTQAAVDKVICVPWQGNINSYHTTVDGHAVEIKGVVKTTNTDPIWYKWVYGDGTESVVDTATGKTQYAMQTTHAYTGAVGTPFTAKLVVADVDTLADAKEDNYLLKIENVNLDAKINMAIDRGLWFLYKNGVTSSTNYHTYDSSPYAVWAYGSYYGSPTASAIHAFQINGHKETGNFDEDPYAEYVQLGFNWLFNGYFSTSYPMLQRVSIGVQHGTDDPDSRPNGIGIECRDYGYRPIYQSGMVMDAIIASGTPNADSGRDFDGDGRNETYQEVLQDMVDMYAWGQYDGGTPILGGWRYSWNDPPDNSACQWGAIGMIPAQRAPWNCVVPDWVKTYDDNWLNYSHSSWTSSGVEYGGFGYTSAGSGVALTPSGMVQLDFCGKTTSDPRWVRCERWLADSWTSWLGQNNVYAYYAFAKAMRLALPSAVVTFSAGPNAGLDWYRGGATTLGLAEKISDVLLASGNWDFYGNNLGTAWCVIILKPVLFAESPIACFDADPNPNFPDKDISFDPGCSGHSAYGKDIDNLTKFEWDWESDGTYDESYPTPFVVKHAFGCTSIPCTYKVTLRVTDDEDNTATYALDIRITQPPHPPVARIKGPLMISLCEGEALTLDASESYDPDEGTSHPGNDPDTITKREWDLDGAPFTYEGPTGEILELGTDFTTYFPTAGIYDIGHRVTDNSKASYDAPEDLTDEDFTQLRVYNCFDAGLTATAGCGYVTLNWNAAEGADKYIIYLSRLGADLGFEDTSNTTDTTKTMGSFVMGMDTWYRVMAVYGDTGRLSKAVMINADPHLCDPTADAGGPYEVCYGEPVTLDASGSSAQVGTIVAWDWDLDNDGEFDDAFGETVEHTWDIPGDYPVGLKTTSSDSLTLFDVDQVIVQVNACQIDVSIDIKPTSCPNPLETTKNGVLPIAVLGTAEFTVADIDPATVGLTRPGIVDAGGKPVVVKAIRHSYEDVATPFVGPECDCHTLGADGFMDLSVKFDAPEVVAKLKLNEVEDGTLVPLVLVGNLRSEEPGPEVEAESEPAEPGTPIVGRDCVRIQQQKEKKK